MHECLGTSFNKQTHTRCLIQASSTYIIEMIKFYIGYSLNVELYPK